jgi:hypothetical protein
MECRQLHLLHGEHVSVVRREPPLKSAIVKRRQAPNRVHDYRTNWIAFWAISGISGGIVIASADPNPKLHRGLP